MIIYCGTDKASETLRTRHFSGSGGVLSIVECYRRIRGGWAWCVVSSEIKEQPMHDGITHVGQPFAPIARILDAHLPATAHWTVEWDGESAVVSTDCGSFAIASGRVWGPSPTTAGTPIGEVVREAIAAVRGPLYDRLIDRMCGRSA